MKVVLLGYSDIKSGNYQGRDWSNRQLYVRHCTPANGVTGEQVEVIKVPVTIDVSGFKLGDTYDVYYNRYGKVDSVVLNKPVQQGFKL